MKLLSKEISERMYKTGNLGKPFYAPQKNKLKKRLFYFLDRRKRILFSFLPKKEKQKVLDFGCGGGYLAIPLAKEHDFKVYGCDISDYIIRILRVYCHENKIQIKLETCGEWRLPYPDNYFDAIISADVLGHVSDPKKMLCELHRVLKKGGVLSLHTESLHFFERYHYRRIARLLGYNPWGDKIGHINLKLYPDIVKDIKSAGFKIKKVLSAPQYLGFILNGDIYLGLRELKQDMPFDLKILKRWQEFVFKSRHTYIRLLVNLLLVLEEEAEFKFKKKGGSIYFKLMK